MGFVHCSCYVGEASHPGPPLIIGAANPTGILGKEQLIACYLQVFGLSPKHISQMQESINFRGHCTLSMAKMDLVS